MLCALLRAIRVFFIGTALFSSKATVHMDEQQVVAVTYQFSHQGFHIDHRSTWIHNQSYRECFAVQPTSIRPTPAQATPVRPTPAQPTSIRPTPAQATPVRPTPVRPTPVRPTPVQSTPEVVPIKYDEHLKKVIDKRVNPLPTYPAPVYPHPIHDTDHSVPQWKLHTIPPRPTRSIASLSDASTPTPLSSSSTPSVPESSSSSPSTLTPLTPLTRVNTTTLSDSSLVNRSRRPIPDSTLRHTSNTSHLQHAGNASSDHRHPISPQVVKPNEEEYESDGNESDGNESDGNESDGNESDGNESDGNESDEEMNYWEPKATGSAYKN